MHLRKASVRAATSLYLYTCFAHLVCCGVTYAVVIYVLITFVLMVSVLGCVSIVRCWLWLACCGLLMLPLFDVVDTF